jgi:hypothetical protein
MFGLNLLMLLGLGGLAIPPLIHLLNRRRYDVVHWGAMQFLEISETTRRRLLIEELLLMALRMLLIAMLVLALASPFVLLSFLDRVGVQENRDVVIVLDGSASMSTRDGETSPHDEARKWAREFVDRLRPGDSVAIVDAKQQVIPIVGELTHDVQAAAKSLDELPPPSGSCDMPLAVDAAYRILATSNRPRQEIVILTDGQRHGWADESTQARWQRLKKKLDPAAAERTNLWVVNLQGERSTPPPNWILEGVHSGRALAVQRVFFETELRLHGQPYEPPYNLRLEVDEVPLKDLPAPKASDLRSGQIPLNFEQAFTPGSHLLSLIVEPDPPQEQRGPGYMVKDQVPADNRQDFAVMVRLLPVLLVDGAPQKPRQHGADLLMAALTASEGNTSLVRAKLITASELGPVRLTEPIGPEPDTRPRVLILCNVTDLSPEQQLAVARFVEEGGRVLVTLGQRTNRDHYNNQLYRRGDGWLPTTLVEIQGDEFAPIPADPSTPDAAPHLLKANYTHPALGLLRSDSTSDLDHARFPRWWNVAEPSQSSGAVVIVRFDNKQPFLIERAFGKGDVILCTVPLDESWNTNLHRGVTGTTPLMHELLYHLMGARSIEYNLVPGRPIVFQPVDDESPGTATLQPPRGKPKYLEVDRWPLVYDATGEPGVYRLTTPAGKIVYYVVQPDTHDGDDLTSCTDQDRETVSSILPFQYDKDANTILKSPGQPIHLWWWLLIGLILLLCFEVGMTRRITKNR